MGIFQYDNAASQGNRTPPSVRSQARSWTVVGMRARTAILLRSTYHDGYGKRHPPPNDDDKSTASPKYVTEIRKHFDASVRCRP